MRELILDAPWMQVAPAIGLVVMAAALLYRIDRGNRHIPAALRAVLGILRAAVLATLLLLLFRPVPSEDLSRRWNFCSHWQRCLASNH